MDEIIDKYSISVIANLNKDNIVKIIVFLEQQQCNFIEDIVTDYLDLLVIDYNEFVDKYNALNEKYNGRFLELVGENMDLLEEFYY